MISVLTGDIVDSQGLSPAKLAQLPSYLEEAAALTDLSVCFEVFGGDSWQTTCHPPSKALTLAVQVRSYLWGKYGIDTRLSIGIGDYETLNPEKISLSQGEAFVLSGRKLADMPRERRLLLQLSDQLGKSHQYWAHASACLLDGITHGWTRKQALAVALNSPSENQADTAKKFDPPISAQAYGKHLSAAQWSQISDALGSIESALRSILRET